MIPREPRTKHTTAHDEKGLRTHANSCVPSRHQARQPLANILDGPGPWIFLLLPEQQRPPWLPGSSCADLRRRPQAVQPALTWPSARTRRIPTRPQVRLALYPSILLPGSGPSIIIRARHIKARHRLQTQIVGVNKAFPIIAGQPMPLHSSDGPEMRSIKLHKVDEKPPIFQRVRGPKSFV